MMRPFGATWVSAAFALLAALIIAPPASHAAKVLVAVDGVDTTPCGTKAAPCRTIGFAIALAAPNDTVLVGPGHYGDLDGDGALTRNDEERFGSASCMVNVDKPLTLLSTAGAAATVIDGGGGLRAVMCANEAGTVIGKRKKGFTFTGAGGVYAGLFVVVDSPTSGVLIAGNRAVKNGFGFTVFGHNVMRGNHAVGNADVGIAVGGPGTVVESSVISGNGGTGLILLLNTGVFRDLVVSGNGGHGIQTNGAAAIQRTVVTANARSGVYVAVPGTTITGSAVLGNATNGVEIFAGADVHITQSNIAGNGPAVPGGPIVANCGLTNNSTAQSSALGVWWGAPDGPGPNPADYACSPGEIVTITPAAAKPYTVKPKLASPD